MSALLTKLLQPTRSPDGPSLDTQTKLQVDSDQSELIAMVLRTCRLYAAPRECEQTWNARIFNAAQANNWLIY